METERTELDFNKNSKDGWPLNNNDCPSESMYSHGRSPWVQTDQQYDINDALFQNKSVDTERTICQQNKNNKNYDQNIEEITPN